MGTSSILRFADNPGANVQSDVDYAADAQRPEGNQPGIARSALNNKAFRQASAIAAAVAQFIAQNQANDVSDSVDTADLVLYLQAALPTELAPTLRDQTRQAYTSTGTGAAYVLTPLLPALAAYVANKTRFNVTFHATNTVTNPTINVSGLGPVPIKVLGANNARVDPKVGQLPVGFTADLVYDGASFVVLSGGSGAGATGGGSDEVFFENGINVTSNYTITAGKNAMSAGPITINVGVTVTVPVGSTYTVV